MKKYLMAAAALMFLALPAMAGPSTIDPTIPATNSLLSSAAMRGNFAAAYSDVNKLIGQNSGTSAPASPVLGQLWLDTTTTPYVLNEWDGGAWVARGTLNASTHAWGSSGTINGNTFTAGTGTLTIGAGKTLTASNTLALAGTDGTVMTFPTTSATVARTDAANAFLGIQSVTATSASPVLVLSQSGAGPTITTAGGAVYIGNSTGYQEPFNVTTPNFQLVGNSSATTGMNLARFQNNGVGQAISFLRSRGASIGTQTVVQSGDSIGKIGWAASDGTNFITTALIESTIDGTPGTNDMPGRLVFSTTQDGFTNPSEALRIDNGQRIGVGATPAAGDNVTISKAITGSANARGIVENSIVQLDVTTSATYMAVTPGLVASASLTEINGVDYSQGTFGAGSTLTNQYAFRCRPTVTGATNNYCFRGQVAAGTGRYNIYMDGTAQNFIAGDMQWGKTVTAAGTTGAQTINKTALTVNFAALATSLVVTNSLVATTSVITCTPGTVDSTMKSVVVVAGAGSFTITANAAATAETRVNCLVFN